MSIFVGVDAAPLSAPALFVRDAITIFGVTCAVRHSIPPSPPPRLPARLFGRSSFNETMSSHGIGAESRQ